MSMVIKNGVCYVNLVGAGEVRAEDLEIKLVQYCLAAASVHFGQLITQLTTTIPGMYLFVVSKNIHPY